VIWTCILICDLPITANALLSVCPVFACNSGSEDHM